MTNVAPQRAHTQRHDQGLSCALLDHKKRQALQVVLARQTSPYHFGFVRGSRVNTACVEAKHPSERVHPFEPWASHPGGGYLIVIWLSCPCLKNVFICRAFVVVWAVQALNESVSLFCSMPNTVPSFPAVVSGCVDSGG